MKKNQRPIWAVMLFVFALLVGLLGFALFLSPFFADLFTESTNVFRDSHEEFSDKVARNDRIFRMSFAVAAGGMLLMVLSGVLAKVAIVGGIFSVGSSLLGNQRASSAPKRCESCGRVSPSSLAGVCGSCGAPLPP